MMEFVDVVDSQDNVIGEVEINKAMGIKHKNRSVHVLVFNDEGKILSQFRHPNKKTRPSCWTSSVAGTVSAGESPLKSALREAKEELGIQVTLTFIGKMNQNDDVVNEFVYVYEGKHNGPFSWDKSEMTEIRWFDIKSLLEEDLNLDPNFRDSLTLWKDLKRLAVKA